MNKDLKNKMIVGELYLDGVLKDSEYKLMPHNILTYLTPKSGKMIVLTHFPVLSIKTNKLININGKKENLVISFQECSDGYMKFNGTESNLYYQAFVGYAISEIVEIFTKVINEIKS